MVLSLYRSLFFMLSVLTALCFASISYSATLKGYDKDQFSRLVISSKAPASYSLKDIGGDQHTLSLVGDDIVFSSDNINASRLTEIEQTKPNGITLTISAGATLRHFKTGSKIIIDIHGGSKTTTSVKQRKKPVETAQTEKQTKVASTSIPSVTSHKQRDTSPQQKSITTDHVIQITAAETISVAAFTRHDTLWMIVDKPDFLIPPTIEGPQRHLFPGFERIKLPQATGFKMKIPMGSPLFIYAEGGGLIWRLVLTPDADKLKKERGLVATSNRLLWPDTQAQRIMKISDPDQGDVITVITSQKVGAPILYPKNYVQLSTLPSYIGLAMLSKTDDLKTTINADGVAITADSGSLYVSADGVGKDNKDPSSHIKEPSDLLNLTYDKNRIFQFDAWQLGETELYTHNERLLMASAAGKDENNRLDDLVKLARFEVAHCRPAEAIGFLELIKDIYPTIVKSPEFLALLGAGYSLGGQHNLAHEALSQKSLSKYGELGLWKSFTLAGLEDWNQAGKKLPKELGVIALYPPCLQNKLGLTLSEIALRQGRTSDADILLALISENMDILSPSDIATHDYLLGESNRQQLNIDEAKEIWTSLLKSKDDLYRTKAGLALTRLLYDEESISADDAIDRLERLRYAWRGDDLETQINYRLGLAYLDNKDYIRGLNILRSAASRSPDPVLARKIAEEMATEFKRVFTTESLNTLSPLDAITLYEEFSELTPSGTEGRILTQKLADRLVDIDLLGRAGALLKTQMNSSDNSEDKTALAIRLASVQLSDSLPKEALQTLQQASSFLPSTSGAQSDQVSTFRQDIGLLKAHAYSTLKQTENALVALSRLTQTNQVTRLRADIAWRAMQWQTASEALEELVNRSNIDLNTTLDNDQAELVLNWAITLNLSDNRYILNSLRDRFGSVMKDTPLGRQFEVITRSEQQIYLSDRKTIKGMIAEVDIFDGFLDKYATSQ